MPFGRKEAKEVQAGAIRLFNIDLHLAVIADVKDVLFRLYGNRVHVTDWSINVQHGPKFGFEKPTKTHVEISAFEQQCGKPNDWVDATTLNSMSWYDFNQDLVDRFLLRYWAILSKYDGFIVTHTPVFARLFERFEKPVILVNSCRYDQPFMYNGNTSFKSDDKEREALHECLKRLHDKGLLIAISNNRADQEYLRLGAGIESIRLPSLCLYTKVNVNFQRAKSFPALIVSQKTLRIPDSKKILLESAGLLQTSVTKQSEGAASSGKSYISWDDLYHRKALIHFPYEMSTMSFFEQYSSGAVLLFPTRRFCEELMKNREAENWEAHVTSGVGTLRIASMYWRLKFYQDVYNSLEQLPPFFRAIVAKHHHTVTENANGSWDYEFWNPQRQIPRSLECTQDVAWWLDRADFFDEEWFPGLKYFDSWEELVALAVQEPDDEEERHRAEWLETRNAKVLATWRTLILDKFPQLS